MKENERKIPSLCSKMMKNIYVKGCLRLEGLKIDSSFTLTFIPSQSIPFSLSVLVTIWLYSLFHLKGFVEIVNIPYVVNEEYETCEGGWVSLWGNRGGRINHQLKQFGFPFWCTGAHCSNSKRYIGD